VIVREILEQPGMAADFDYFNDFQDTEAWLRGHKGRPAWEALRALRTGYGFWKRERAGEATFEIVTRGLANPPTFPGQVGIRCLVCGLTSFHADDVGELYCGHCNRFHKDPPDA
jgi:hypothetical protein